ncbi:MAG: YIP1 family protein [Pyrinomonadaceae bacterium]|nr:YIP1 family protein [Pyrinomonadaceae bacterium]MCX7639039.1 YIP1 family protein [Pyrinomonadaceae bacterium]MDW8303740.1 YIP1 family protein [Acidobacteriota bacterium]
MSQELSELQSVGNIFFEPSKAFECLRERPRFILATIILAVLSLVFSVALFQKIGEENYRRFLSEQNERSAQYQALSTEEKENALNAQVKWVEILSYLSPIFTIAYIALGGLIALAIGKAIGGEMNYSQGVSLWIYSAFPPSVVFTIASLIVLLFKPSEQIDLIRFQYSGLLPSNLGFFVNPKEMPALSALLGGLDIFRLWGWALFAIGLERMARVSSGIAWTTSVFLFAAFVAIGVISAFIFGAG